MRCRIFLENTFNAKLLMMNALSSALPRCLISRSTAAYLCSDINSTVYFRIYARKKATNILGVLVNAILNRMLHRILIFRVKQRRTYEQSAGVLTRIEGPVARGLFQGNTHMRRSQSVRSTASNISAEGSRIFLV